MENMNLLITHWLTMMMVIALSQIGSIIEFFFNSSKLGRTQEQKRTILVVDVKKIFGGNLDFSKIKKLNIVCSRFPQENIL